MGCKIGARIGKVIEVDSKRKKSWRKDANGEGYMRIKVQLNVACKLPRGFSISEEDGTKYWIWLRYERLPNFCFDCGLIGHVVKECSAICSSSMSASQYGDWLRASSEQKHQFQSLVTTAFVSLDEGQSVQDGNPSGLALIPIVHREDAGKTVYLEELENLGAVRNGSPGDAFFRENSNPATVMDWWATVTFQQFSFDKLPPFPAPHGPTIPADLYKWEGPTPKGKEKMLMDDIPPTLDCVGQDVLNDILTKVDNEAQPVAEVSCGGQGADLGMLLSSFRFRSKGRSANSNFQQVRGVKKLQIKLGQKRSVHKRECSSDSGQGRNQLHFTVDGYGADFKRRRSVVPSISGHSRYVEIPSNQFEISAEGNNDNHLRRMP